MVFSVKWFIVVLTSWCLSLLIEKIPLTKADEYFPFRLQLISFLKKFDPEDRTNVSEMLFLSCSILLKEYLMFLFSNLSTLKFFKTEFSFNSKL